MASSSVVWSGKTGLQRGTRAERGRALSVQAASAATVSMFRRDESSLGDLQPLVGTGE